MSFNEKTIQVANLSKIYQIYSQPIDRLKQSLLPRVLKPFRSPARTYYREFWALRDISFEVKKGETVGVIGRNGSGKSTLLQLVCGTLTPTSGHIHTQGRITALLELGSGFNPEFSGRENVFLNGAILGLSYEEIRERFIAIADFADIGDFIDQPVKIYSSGMTIRLAFAVQAMVDPDILIVDEALAVGDERFQRKCFRRLEELRKKGTSILFVSHAGQQVIELCDRAILIEHGERLLMTDPQIVVKAYQKLIYAEPAEQARLIREYKNLDQGVPVALAQQLQDATTPDLQTIASTEDNSTDSDFYESGMIPESTDIYPTQGARIDSLKIYNAREQEVNNLLAGEVYKFELCGVFLKDRKDIHINININPRSFAGLAGLVYPGSGKHIRQVKRGQRFRLTHMVRINLAPDIYFAGSGIWAASEPACMHRIVDLIMFRVLSKKENRAFGYVDLTVSEPEFEITSES
jgi:lipopolysaccharide transport system ATP-binding protein